MHLALNVQNNKHNKNNEKHENNTNSKTNGCMIVCKALSLKRGGYQLRRNVVQPFGQTVGGLLQAASVSPQHIMHQNETIADGEQPSMQTYLPGVVYCVREQ